MYKQHNNNFSCTHQRHSYTYIITHFYNNHRKHQFRVMLFLPICVHVRGRRNLAGTRTIACTYKYAYASPKKLPPTHTHDHFLNY